MTWPTTPSATRSASWTASSTPRPPTACAGSWSSPRRWRSTAARSTPGTPRGSRAPSSGTRSAAKSLGVTGTARNWTTVTELLEMARGLRPGVRAYVIVDVFTDVPLEGNPVAVFTEAAGLEAELMQRTARELNLSETVFVFARRRRRGRRPDPDLHAGHRAPVRRAPGARAPRSCSGERDRARARRGCRPASGLVDGCARSASGERIAYGEMGQPIPTWEPLEARGRAAGRAGRASARRCRSRSTTTDRDTRSSRSTSEDAGRRADARTSARSRSSAEFGVSCFAGRRAPGSRRGCSVPALGVAEDPATGSAAGPLAVHLARHGGSQFGQRIEIRQGAEIGRPSVLHAIGRGVGRAHRAGHGRRRRGDRRARRVRARRLSRRPPT